MRCIQCDGIGTLSLFAILPGQRRGRTQRVSCDTCGGTGEVPDNHDADASAITRVVGDFRQIEVGTRAYSWADPEAVAANGVHWRTSEKGNPWTRVLVNGVEHTVVVFPNRYLEGSWSYIWSRADDPAKHFSPRNALCPTIEDAQAAALLACGYTAAPAASLPAPPRPKRQAVPEGRDAPPPETPVRKIILD